MLISTYDSCGDTNSLVWIVAQGLSRDETLSCHPLKPAFLWERTSSWLFHPLIQNIVFLGAEIEMFLFGVDLNLLSNRSFNIAPKLPFVSLPCRCWELELFRAVACLRFFLASESSAPMTLSRLSKYSSILWSNWLSSFLGQCEKRIFLERF